MPDHFTIRDLFQLIVPVASDDSAKAALEQVQVWARLTRSTRESGSPLDVRLGDLSVGERQRVVLARTIVQSSSLVLLDEPDENLDVEGRALLAQVVRHLASTRMVALVAHDERVLTLADHVVDLDSRRKVSLRPVS